MIVYPAAGGSKTGGTNGSMVTKTKIESLEDVGNFLSGTVSVCDGFSISDCMVYLAGISVVVIPDATGVFTMINVPEGTYSM
ncbi:MAG: hypothetical protein JW863_14735 [Chitinispirillaceae bacterium]|nr:hypothetical protein [Chitinispirillaceae bacterium]